MEAGRSSRVARLLAQLVRAYPPAFRTRFRGQYEDVIHRLAGEPRHQGWRGRLALARWLIADAAQAAPAEWKHLARTRVESSASFTSHRGTGDRMDTLWQDLKYAARSLRRAPGFALVVVVSLALGIGANTLVFSVLDGLVLRPFAFPDANRLVAIGATFPKISGDRQYIEVLSPPEYLDIRQGTRAFERFTAFDLGNRTISGGDRAERVFTAFVWNDPQVTIGLPPALGRGFREEETTTPGSSVAMLSHRIWKSRFGGDSSLVGRAIRVNGVPVTVVGIMHPSVLLLGADLWLPMSADPQDIPRKARQWAILARLRPGVSAEAANRELAEVARRTEAAHGGEHDVYVGWRLEATPWAEALSSQGGMRMAAFILQGAVFLVLLIATVNVAGLMLSRAATRGHEIAMRRALGAKTSRLTRQLLTEGVLLSCVGGAAGLAIAMGLMGPLTRALPDLVLSMGIEARPNLRVLVITLIVSVGTGLAFGLAPAFTLAMRRTAQLIGTGTSRTTLSRRGRRVRAGFLVTQVALSMVLLFAAGLLFRSLNELKRVDLGFAPDRVLTMRVSVAREKYPREDIIPFIERLVDRIGAIPGVQSAGAATQYPPLNVFQSTLSLAGEAPGSQTARQVDVTNATPGFLTTLGIRLQGGRMIEPSDNEQSPRVALINEMGARRFFAGRSPIGERVFLGDSASGAAVEIVGVTGDVRNRGLDAPVAPELIVPARQQQVEGNNQYYFLVRTTGEPMLTLPGVREAVQREDPDQPIYAIGTVERDIGDSLLGRRAAMLFLAVFAGIAVTLACVGIYGLVSYSVNERVREIGIRMALGAAAQDVRRLVLRQTLVVVVLGVLIGLAAALGASGALRSLVYGISPTDPVTLLAVALLLPAVGVAAGVIPMRRATRIHPVEALREE